MSKTSFFKVCAIIPILFQSEFHVMNPAKLYEKKAPKKGREKETRGQHQSPKQTAPKKAGHQEESEPLTTKSSSHMKHIN
jgi:hypothetical protein